MSERQVFRNGQHDRSRQLRREFVELTHRRGANARIEARKIFRITCFPRKSFRERVERSVLTNSKSGAAAPALTNSPAICTGCPLNFVIDISLFLLIIKPNPAKSSSARGFRRDAKTGPHFPTIETKIQIFPEKGKILCEKPRNEAE